MRNRLAKNGVRQVERSLTEVPVCLALVLVLIATTAWTPSALAQTTQEQSSRKLRFSVKPEYPASLQQAQIGGTVRLTATVLPNGTVSKVQIRGGNPILAESASVAVMKWKYAPASTESNEEIAISFSPRHSQFH